MEGDATHIEEEDACNYGGRVGNAIDASQGMPAVRRNWKKQWTNKSFPGASENNTALPETWLQPSKTDFSLPASRPIRE